MSKNATQKTERIQADWTSFSDTERALNEAGIEQLRDEVRALRFQLEQANREVNNNKELTNAVEEELRLQHDEVCRAVVAVFVALYNEWRVGH